MDTYSDYLQVSQRGVVFLRNQDVTPREMRELAERLSRLSGPVSLQQLIFLPRNGHFNQSRIC